MPGMHWKRSLARMERDNETEKHEFNPTTLEIAQKIVAAIKFLKKALSVFSFREHFPLNYSSL